MTTEVRLAGPLVEHLGTVDGMIVFDLPGAPVSGGGTRLAADLTEVEMRLLARAMTYKLAVLELPVGGAKIGLRATEEPRATTIARFREEIAPRLESGALMTGPDLGTAEEDFAGLPTPGGAQGIAASARNGTPVEEMLTGHGVAAAIRAALGGELDGRSVALEGFGKMGASIARALSAHGARIVAVSTVDGCAVSESSRGFALEHLLEARADWGDRLVRHLGVDAGMRDALWATPCDALVPGARPGVIDARVAVRVKAHAVVPVANAPYTVDGLMALRGRNVAAHADFVASSGGAMTYLSPEVSGATDVRQAQVEIERLIGALVEETLTAGGGPYAAAVGLAHKFLRSWLPADEVPSRPPLIS